MIVESLKSAASGLHDKTDLAAFQPVFDEANQKGSQVGKADFHPQRGCPAGDPGLAPLVANTQVENMKGPGTNLS